MRQGPQDNHMSYLFRGLTLPGAGGLLAKADAAATRLAAKLAALDLSAVPLSTPSQTLLADKLAHPVPTMQVSTYLLVQALRLTDKPPEQVVLCDYGGGTGLLSFLALEMGVGQVLYVDLAQEKHADALALAAALGYALPHAVLGDVDAALAHVQKHGITPDVVCSFDVLEHIYDLPAHFTALDAISPGPLAYVMASTANQFHAGIRRRWLDVQRRAETQGYGGPAYVAVRTQMIRERLAERTAKLPPHTLEELARATRGRHRQDVHRAVDALLDHAIMPQPPEHPTNTCNPATGSWLDRLFDHRELLPLLKQHGFEARIAYGLYGDSPHQTRTLLAEAVNRAITLAGPLARFAAPFYTLLARRR